MVSRALVGLFGYGMILRRSVVSPVPRNVERPVRIPWLLGADELRLLAFGSAFGLGRYLIHRGDNDGGALWKASNQFECPTHRFNVAAHCRKQHITSLFQARYAVLA